MPDAFTDERHEQVSIRFGYLIRVLRRAVWVAFEVSITRFERMLYLIIEIRKNHSEIY